MCDDVLLISSCINASIADEIYWPTTHRELHWAPICLSYQGA